MDSDLRWSCIHITWLSVASKHDQFFIVMKKHDLIWHQTQHVSSNIWSFDSLLRDLLLNNYWPEITLGNMHLFEISYICFNAKIFISATVKHGLIQTSQYFERQSSNILWQRLSCFFVMWSRLDRLMVIQQCNWMTCGINALCQNVEIFFFVSFCSDLPLFCI